MRGVPAAAPALRHDLHRAGYYPDLVVDVLDVALADEEVVAHLVHPETTFDAAEVRRHVTVLVLTPTRLVVAHVDDHPADSEHPSASASATTEAVPLRELHVGRVTHVVPQPAQHSAGAGAGADAGDRLGRGLAASTWSRPRAATPPATPTTGSPARSRRTTSSCG